MSKLFVHIGRNKTGTSTLQRFFFENTKQLTELGFYYPVNGQRAFGHHLFAEPLSRKSVRTGVFKREDNELIRQKVIQEIEENITRNNVLLSSEAFQNCAPKVVHQLLEKFSPIYIVYLREQVGYLISSYAQAIQATNLTMTIEEYSEKKLSADYDTFLKTWTRVVGRERLRVHIYDRDQLVDSDIVKNFLIKDLGIEKTLWNTLTFIEKDQNPSLGTNLIEFKRLINMAGKCHTGAQYNAFMKLVNHDTSTKPKLSKSCYEAIINRFAESNKKVEEQYFNGKNVLQFSQQKVFSRNYFSKVRKRNFDSFNK